MTPSEFKLARRMRREGASDSAIAESMSPPVTRQHIHATLGPRRRVKATPKPAAFTIPSKPEFAATLRGWRARRGLTQHAAADLLHVNRSIYGFWEREYTGCALAAAILLLMQLLDEKET